MKIPKHQEAPGAVARTCLDLWARIVETISKMRAEITKKAASPPPGMSATARRARLQQHRALKKRVAKLLGAAQTGFQYALGTQEIFGAGGAENRSNWEQEKLSLQPEVRQWLEKMTSAMMSFSSERQSAEIRSVESLVSQIWSPKTADRETRAAVGTADLILEIRLTEIYEVKAQLQQIQESLNIAVVGDRNSQSAKAAQLLGHIGDMKLLIDSLHSAQQGFRSAVFVKNRLSAEEPEPQDGTLKEDRMREVCEKLLFTAYVNCKTFNMPLPELDDPRSRS